MRLCCSSCCLQTPVLIYRHCSACMILISECSQHVTISPLIDWRWRTCSDVRGEHYGVYVFLCVATVAISDVDAVRLLCLCTHMLWLVCTCGVYGWLCLWIVAGANATHDRTLCTCTVLVRAYGVQCSWLLSLCVQFMPALYMYARVVKYDNHFFVSLALGASHSLNCAHILCVRRHMKTTLYSYCAGADICYGHCVCLIVSIYAVRVAHVLLLCGHVVWIAYVYVEREESYCELCTSTVVVVR